MGSPICRKEELVKDGAEQFEHGGFSPDCLLAFILSLMLILLLHKWHPLNTTNELLQ